jgi:hypothetical protein
MLDRSRFERELEDLDLGAPRFGRGETTPKPIRLTHHHVRKSVDPATGAFKTDPSPGVMTPARMAPGYVAVGHTDRQELQKALLGLFRGSYAPAISPLHLRSALVDLTGAKGRAPVFSGLGAFMGDNNVEGASLTKILALYALFQLKFDLNTYARLKSIDKAATLRTSIAADWKKEGLNAVPQMTVAFRFVEKAGSPVAAEVKIGTDIHHNDVAREIILALGFEYIGSVALQSGLFDEALGGLWLNAAYGFPAVTWTTSPFPKLARHNVTAASAATFFTLLAQGRLADQATSDVISGILKRRICMNNGLLDGINTLPGTVRPSANKCGILAPLFHDAVHVIRQVPAGPRLEYVAVLLTEEPPVLDFKKIGIELDGLIVAANP